MVQKQQFKDPDMHNVQSSKSQLERFSLEFEYDKTFRQVKHDTRVRTLGY